MFDFICGLIGVVLLVLIIKEKFVAKNSSSYTKNLKKEEKYVFTDEERLALGLYPKDEGYKMYLISKILNKQ